MRDEIEITPEMIEAGAAPIFEWREFSTAWDLAVLVYQAMERARLDEQRLVAAGEIHANRWCHWPGALSKKSHSVLSAARWEDWKHCVGYIINADNVDAFITMKR